MRLLLKWKQMPKLLRLTPFFSLMVLSLAAAPQSGATPFDETLAAALGNSLSLQSSRQEWLAAREEIGTSVSTSEWRSTGTFTGSHTKKDAASARKSGFLDSQSVNATISLSKNIYDGGQTDQTSQLRQLQLGVAEAKLRAAEQQVLLSASRPICRSSRRGRRLISTKPMSTGLKSMLLRRRCALRPALRHRQPSPRRNRDSRAREQRLWGRWPRSATPRIHSCR